MQERLLQFIWQHQYYDTQSLTTTAGLPLVIRHPGNLNTNQGPDFLQARLLIGDTAWAGNIELHIRSSDWLQHGHSDDAHYRNVILHVVWEHDAEINHLPVLELGGRVSRTLMQRYEQLMHKGATVPCTGDLQAVKEITWSAWKTRLVAERLEARAEAVNERLQQSMQHWEEVFWWMLARNFGISVNADAFEAMARTISVTLLAKHRNQIHQLEALLMGQAGLLEQEMADAYPQMLQKEYRFLRSKYNLKSANVPLQFLRMRPMAFPTVRLAMLAMLVHRSRHLFSKLIETGTVAEAQQLFDVAANDYWHYHYVFGQETAYREKKPGKMLVQNLLINTVIPILYAYGHHHRQEQYKDRAIQWLEQLSKENNSITSAWEQAGVAHKNAFDSQALIHLKKHYCDQQQCLRCAVGNAVLKQ